MQFIKSLFFTAVIASSCFVLASPVAVAEPEPAPAALIPVPATTGLIARQSLGDVTQIIGTLTAIVGPLLTTLCE